MPVVVAGDPAAKEMVQIFFSPSCPDCFLAYRNAVTTLLAGPVKEGKVLLIGYLMARQQSDLRLGQILTCVPQQHLAATVTRFMLDRSRGVQYGDDELLGLIRKHGSTAGSVEDCMDDSRELALARINAVGIGLGIDDTPAWFIRGVKYQQVYYYWQLRPLLGLKD